MPHESPQHVEASPTAPFPSSPVVEITYADERTDRDRRDELAPDLVEARIAANAIGAGFLLAGFLFVLFVRLIVSWTVLAMVAASYILPGVTLLLAGQMIAQRRRAGVVVAMAGGGWVMLAMATLATAELVALLTRTWTIGSPWFRVLIHLLFLGLAAKLAFHAFRAALFAGRAENVGVASWLTPEGVMPRLVRVTRLMLLVSLGSHLLLLGAAGGCRYLSTILKMPFPPPPPFTAYVGNVNRPPPFGLGAVDRAVVIRYLRTLQLNDDELREADAALRDHADTLVPATTQPFDESEQSVGQILRTGPTTVYRWRPISPQATGTSVIVKFRRGDLVVGGGDFINGRWRIGSVRYWSVAEADRVMQEANARLGGRISDRQGTALVLKAGAYPWSSTVANYDADLPAPFVNLRLDADGNLRAQTATGQWLVTPSGQALDANADDDDRARHAGRWTTKLAIDPRAPSPLLWCGVAGVVFALWALLFGRATARVIKVWAYLRLFLLGLTALTALWLLSSILVTALKSQEYGLAVAGMTFSVVVATLMVAEGTWFPLIVLQADRIQCREAASV